MRVILIMIISLMFTSCATSNQNNINNRGVIVKQNNLNEEKVALVIGNNDYQKPFSTLNNTINDAKAMKDILENRGFRVIYRTNITKREFDNSLEKFYQKLRNSSIGLLYFSGHGLESRGENYLIPIDANIRAKSDTKYEAVALNKITERMQSENDKLNIVILDACRNDPFAKAMGVGGLAKTDPPIGLFVSYATSAGKVSSDGTLGGNGLFTTYLIKYIKEPLSFKDVFQKAREAVYIASNKTQFPAVYDNTINVNFYFTLPKVNNIKTSSNKVSKFDKNSKLLALEKACNLGDGKACDLLGNKYYYGDIISKDYNKALKLYRKSCTLNYGNGCGGLGVMYYKGKGTPKDGAKALKIFTKSCFNLNNSFSCNYIGNSYYYGVGTSKDLSQAVNFYKKACNLKNGQGCTNLGSRYYYGDGGLKKDLFQAVNFYRKACNLKNGEGCLKLGNRYYYGDGGLPKSLSKAKEFYKKACDLNYAKGCTYFATY